MRKWLTHASMALSFAILPNLLLAQVPVLPNPSACGLGLRITDNNCPDGGVFFQPNRFRINVNNAPGNRLGTDVYLKEVRLIILHGWAGDLDISLISPSGKSIRLSFDNGGGDDNYGELAPGCAAYVTFSIAACKSISGAQAPFLDGPYQPEESFTLFNDGTTNPNGDWILQICDDAEDDEGTLEFVQLVFESASCQPIANVNLLEVDTTTVRLSWSPDSCTPVIIEYGPPGFAPGTNQNAGQGTTVAVNVCAPYNLQELLPDTEYDIYVRRRCVINGSFSDNSCPIRVRTGCLPPPSTIVETFDSYASCAALCGAVCNFAGIWRNVSIGDNFDWLVYQGSTPTTGTGPTGDVNGGNGKYVYLEATGAACNNSRVCHLVSNCIRINKQGSDTCHLSFNYHMWGPNIGSLRLQASLDGGATWFTLWERTGDQGNQWHKVYLSLNQFANGAIVQFRFVGVGGNGSRGDIALDNIVFYGSEDLGPPSFTFYADADGDGYGNPNQFVVSCLDEAPSGFTRLGGDCNDNDPNINPAAVEIPCNGIDNNCNGNADENILPPPAVTNDTICSGDVPIICATPVAGRPIFWYASLDGADLIGAGPCFSPNLPLNNSSAPVVHRFYALETDFTCTSSARSEALIIVNPNPNVNHTVTPQICPGETFDLAALVIEDANFTGATITFHNGSPANSGNQMVNTLVVPNGVATYYYLATTPAGCTDEKSVIIQQRPAPNLTFTPSKSFSLCLENTRQVTVNATGGTGNYSYLWSNGETDNDIIINAGNVVGVTRKFFVTVEDTGGCSRTDSVTVTSTSSIDSVRISARDVTSCTGNNGSITVTPLSGQSPFRYAWSSPNGITGSVGGVSGAYTINNLPQGVYRITVTDNSPQACQFFLRQVFVNGPAAIMRTPTIRDVSCAGATDGSITLNVTGANPQYLWSNGATTPSLQNLRGGAYSVTVSEGACTTVLEDLIVREPESLRVVAQLRTPTCAESSDGAIQLSVFGGSGNYSFLWSNGSRRQDLESVPAGNYAVTITDTKGCQVVQIVNLNAPPALVVTVDSLKGISCFNQNDGFVRLATAGGTAPYRYTWNTGSTAPILSNLPAGNYSVTVADFNGCTRVVNVPLAQPTPLQLSIVTQENPRCLGDSTGRLAVAAIGGTTPYRFTWNTGANTPILDNIAVGNYKVTLTDANGCEGGTLEVNLTAVSPIWVIATVNEPECLGREDGRITLQPVGTGPFAYRWNRGDTTQTLTNVGVGDYKVQIKDAEGCLYDTTLTVTAPQAFDLSIIPFQPSCAQSSDGSIEVNFFRAGTPPVTYQWSNGSTEQDLANIRSGNYVLSLTDSRGCRFTSDTIKIINPSPLELRLEAIGPINCTGDSTGFIEIAVEGGTPPYQFDWVGTGKTTEDIFNLSAGNYRLVVQDARQCPIDTIFRLSQPTELRTEVSIRASSDCDENFSNEIRAVTKGGQAPYRYLWSDGSTSPILTNVPPGEYQLSVEDANACTELLPSIKVREAGRALTVDTFWVKDISCFGANDGAMTARVAGGTGPFIFHFSNSQIFTTNEREVTVNGLALNAGYNVTITDVGSGCVVVSPRRAITQPPPLAFVPDRMTEPRCFGGADGSIFASTYGGVLPYSYRWINQNGIIVGTNEDLRNVPNGIYTGIVTDARGCQDTIFEQKVMNANELIRFANPPVVQPVRCKGERTGAIDVTIRGGAPPYEYRWNNNRTTEDISGLPAGIYTLTVTDADTCRVIFEPIVVSEPATGISIAGKVNDILCAGAATGSIEVLAGGGRPPYRYIWEYRGNIFTQDTANLSGLRAGIYNLTVRDSNQCTQTATFEVKEPPRLTANIVRQAGGVLAAAVSGGMPSYRYLWSNGATTPQITPAEEGRYTLTVTDANGCNAIADLLVADAEVQAGASVRVFPNPTAGQCWLDIRLLRTAQISVEVWNAIGQRIAALQQDQVQQAQLRLDLSGRPSGIYWLNIYANGQSIYAGSLRVE